MPGYRADYVALVKEQRSPVEANNATIREGRMKAMRRDMRGRELRVEGLVEELDEADGEPPAVLASVWQSLRPAIDALERMRNLVFARWPMRSAYSS